MLTLSPARINWWFLIAIAVAALIWVALILTFHHVYASTTLQPSLPPHQVSYMVWDKRCIHRIDQGDKVYMDAPLINGKPNLKQMEIHGLIACYDPKCGHIEIRLPPQERLQ